MKKYVDIERFKEKYDTVFSIGEQVTITEKVDGSNASFTYDPTTNTVLAFSRKNQLNEANTLNGFWNWAQQLNVSQIDMLTQHGRYVIFGEWLTKHTIKYPENRYKNFYMFDVWDTQVEEYLPHEDTYAIFKGLENAVQLTQQVIYFVPIFYTGEFRGWDTVYQLVGQTMLGAEPCGEGVVIKSQDRLDNKNSRTPSYLKIVAEKFSEVHQDHHKPVDPEELKKREAERQYVASVATARRTEKCLQKLVDEGQLRPDWDEHDMGAIAKVLPKMMYEDCRKEEPEVVAACENFGKICGSLTMTYVRDMLKSR